jgi:hypothetical protein
LSCTGGAPDRRCEQEWEIDMQPSRFIALALAVFALALTATTGVAPAQQPAGEYKPQRGQHGKDVVWVPTPQALVDKMLEIARVSPLDYVIDLGSGDGRTVISAAKIGATAKGIEYNPNMVELSRRKAAEAGVSDKATFEKADIFATDFSKADVITLFLLPDLNVKLRPTILAMKPGTRVVSNSFEMGDWKPDRTARATQDCTGYCQALLWIVPAKVEGTWRLGGGELELKQKYQNFTGTLTVGDTVSQIADGRLRATRISFTAGDTHYVGQVKGTGMEGMSFYGDSQEKWTATRK